MGEKVGMFADFGAESDETGDERLFPLSYRR
jgi:hypothetical protein